MAQPNSHLEMQVVARLAARLSLPLTWSGSTQFLLGRDEFIEWARGRKTLRMEDHYRRMRRRTGWLMRPDDTPEGGAWNFDADNRRTHAAWLRAGAPAPALPRPVPCRVDARRREDGRTVVPHHPGDATGLWLPVEVDDARAWLRAFIDERLPLFGALDMMSTRAPYLLHSVLSPLLNLGLLTPHECVEAAIEAYDRGAAPLNAVEGFVRQIIGWREYVVVEYWLLGPIRERERFGARRRLPAGSTAAARRMHCLRHVSPGRSLAAGQPPHRAAHAGRRTSLARRRRPGAVAALVPRNPTSTPTTGSCSRERRGPGSQHADGGQVASKPYVASGPYIRRMSDYCGGCRYDPAVASGPCAVPSIALYWNFIATHADRLATNPRMRPIVAAWRQRPGARAGSDPPARARRACGPPGSGPRGGELHQRRLEQREQARPGLLRLLLVVDRRVRRAPAVLRRVHLDLRRQLRLRERVLAARPSLRAASGRRSARWRRGAAPSSSAPAGAGCPACR